MNYQEIDKMNDGQLTVEIIKMRSPDKIECVLLLNEITRRYPFLNWKATGTSEVWSFVLSRNDNIACRTIEETRATSSLFYIAAYKAYLKALVYIEREGL
jgi:hypothetical protein